VLGAARLPSIWGALAFTGAGSPCHSIIILSIHTFNLHFFTRLVCTDCISISRGPSSSSYALYLIAASPTSHLSHVPQQLRQRFGHLVCAHLICYPSASANPVSPQLAARPYFPGRIRPRSCQARIRSRWHCQQDSRRPRRSQGPPRNPAFYALSPTDSTIHSVTPKNSHHTKRRSSPSTRIMVLPSPVSPPMPASSATS
jgi:hypothetical protein